MPKIPDIPKSVRKQPEKVDISLENIHLFLSQEFPLEEGETKVKYCHIMGLSYRINFYKDVSASLWFSSYEVSRSFFVVLEKIGKVYSVKNKW